MGQGHAALSSLRLAIYVLGSYNAHFSFPTAIIFPKKKLALRKIFGIVRAFGAPGEACRALLETRKWCVDLEILGGRFPSRSPPTFSAWR